MQATQSRLYAGIIAIIGYILSPLSWWNDLFVNVPLAYLFALPFSALNENLYLPAFILGYWLSNLAGFVMLHHSGAVLVRGHTVKSWRGDLIITLLYTVIIVVLVWSGMLPSASELMRFLKG